MHEYDLMLAVNSSSHTEHEVAGAIDVLGIANVAATVSVNSSSADYRRGEYFHEVVSVSNNANPVWQSVNVTTSGGGSESGNVFVPKTPENFVYDYDGNMTNDGRWVFTWDLPHEISLNATQRFVGGFVMQLRCGFYGGDMLSHGASENRLIKLESLASAPSGSKRRLEFEYDWQGRRIKKKVTNLDTSQVLSELKFLYDLPTGQAGGWNLVAELNATNNTVIRSYVWGLDLSGTEQGAGGVGGLLAVNDAANGAHFVCCDGNGNIAALLHAPSSALHAVYEYGPFGEPIRVTGPMAKANPIRFSTKYTDDETGFLNYGHRYYDPSAGRWLSRDPIGEKGGVNLHCFARNAPIQYVDANGLWIPGPNGRPYPPHPPQKPLPPTPAVNPCDGYKSSFQRRSACATASMWRTHIQPTRRRFATDSCRNTIGARKHNVWLAVWSKSRRAHIA